MSISTKTGDKGTTSLWSGERVRKNSLRVDAYGTIDELNSHLGEAKHYCGSDEVKALVFEIQNDLFRVAGSLASIGEYIHPITENDVTRLTEYVHRFEEKVPLKGFVVPGNTLASAKLDICRTIARRAERCMLTLDEGEPLADHLKKYVNRLSDFLFMLARYEELLEGKLEFKKW